MASRPFISYAREDRDIAVLIHAELTAVGAEPWLDAVNLIAGEDWELAIERSLRDATHVVALISERSVSKRGYVQKELSRALSLLEEFPPSAVFIIPVRLDESVPEHPMLRRLQWVDLFQDYGAAFRQLIAGLGVVPAAGIRKPDAALVRGYPDIPRDVVTIIVSHAQRLVADLASRGKFVQKEIGAWHAMDRFNDPALPVAVRDNLLASLAKIYPNHFGERLRMLEREVECWKVLQTVDSLFQDRSRYERVRAQAEQKWPNSFAGQYYYIRGEVQDFQDWT